MKARTCSICGQLIPRARKDKGYIHPGCRHPKKSKVASRAEKAVASGKRTKS